MDLTKESALSALKRLDDLMASEGLAPMSIAIGGGGAMVLAFDFPGVTKDIDAAPVSMSPNMNFESIKKFVPVIAKELNLAGDWLNPYFQTFTHYLPNDAKSRLKEVFKGHVLRACALGAEDIVIMKLMAGRAKDLTHIRFLLKNEKLEFDVIENRLEELQEIYPKEAGKALDLLADLLEGFDEKTGG